MSDDEDILGRAELRRGTVLRGKYRLDRVLGIGGMAAVYEATHRNQKRFAVKMLHPEWTIRSDVRARFLREGYLANTVNHPGVVAVLDDDVADDGSAFLVMELLEGKNLETLGSPAGTRLPIGEALGITDQLLDVLVAAHAKDIVHRDIKPANLFLRTDGTLKVLDFGIARLRDATAGVQTTRTGATLGTPAFMAPEQALAEGGEIDARTDLWAAGATLFWMLCGQFVHEGGNARQILIRAATTPARSLASALPDAPAAVVEWLAKALQFDKSCRWDSAVAMRQALAGIRRDGLGPGAPPIRVSVLQGPSPEGVGGPVESVRHGLSAVASEPIVHAPGSGHASLVATHHDLPMPPLNPRSPRRAPRLWAIGRAPAPRRGSAWVFAAVAVVAASGAFGAVSAKGPVRDRGWVSAGPDPARVAVAGPQPRASAPLAASALPLGDAPASPARPSVADVATVRADGSRTSRSANGPSSAGTTPAPVTALVAARREAKAVPSSKSLASSATTAATVATVRVAPPATAASARNPLLIELQ
jgi:eukaryotic-like serine/threonine-protein kinase